MSESDQKLFGGNLRITGFAVSASPGGDAEPLRKLALKRLDIDGVEGEFGGWHYRAEEVALDGLSGLLGRSQVTAEAGDVTGLHVHGDGFAIDARHLSCASGVLLAGVHELVAPHVSFQDVHLVIDDLGSFLTRRSGPAGQRPIGDTGHEKQGHEKPGTGKQGAGEQILDLHCLDALQGQLDIDLAVDMTLPWLKRRQVTHYFRVPIADGTIDYERLEDDVHWLEAAFLTLDQVEDRLVLARDLPLIPYSGKELLWWQLEPEDIPVADMRRVHLRNLVRPRVATRKREESKKKLVLHELAMQNIKLALRADRPVQLSLPGGAMLQFGDDESAGLAGLTLEGQLRHVGESKPEGKPKAKPERKSDGKPESKSEENTEREPASPGRRAAELTSLRGSVDLLDVTLQDVQAGPVTVSVDRLHIGSIERMELWFAGFRPQRLELSIGRMAATNLRIQTK